VEFKIGSELDILTALCQVYVNSKNCLRLKNADWLLPMSKVLIYAASLFGTSQGGRNGRGSGQNNNADRNMCLSVFANETWEVIPSILPSLATQMILRGEIAYRGIVPLPDWLPHEKILEELNQAAGGDGRENRRDRNLVGC